MTSLQKRTVVTIYATGGTAINIGYLISLEDTLEKANIFCEFRVRYIDTSNKNLLNKNIDMKDVYLFQAEGAGQVRKSVYDLVQATHGDVFKKFAPTDINIVLFGCGGGSGSVIGPVLSSTLIKAGRPTFLVGIGAVDTLKHAENTRDTISTLQGISAKLQRPVILNYHENIPGVVEDPINKKVLFNIITTAVLLSGQVERIDSSDIANWLDYTRVTNQSASLTFCSVVVSNDKLAETVRPFAALSIHRTEAVTPRNDSLDFKKIGYLKDLPGDADSLHFYLDKPSVQETYTRVAKQVEHLTALSAARKVSFDFASSADDDGFVL
jgi:hypothetical protein